MFFVYAIIIFVAFMSFRRVILDNSNVKQLDFSSFIVVFIAAATVPESLITVVKFIVGGLKQFL